MREISFTRPSYTQTIIVWLVTFAAAALLGLVLAYWTWEWFAPRGAPRVEAATEPAGRAESAFGLFGTAQREGKSAAPTGIAIKLLGLAAASGGRRGYAVVQLEANQILAVREGDDIAPGIQLAEVHADHVILQRAGARETLAWPEKTAPRRDARDVAVTPQAPRPPKN